MSIKLIFTITWISAIAVNIVVGFETNFDCREGSFPKEFVDSVKDFAVDSANFYDEQKAVSLDLSTVGLGFVEEDFFPRRYYSFRTFNQSRNNIRSVSVPYWWRFPAVTNLNLSYNCITSINIADKKILTTLIHIDLQHNLIRHIHPFAFSNITHLEEINLSHNKLTRFLAASFSIGKIYLNNNLLSQIVIDSEERIRKTVSLFDARNNSIRIFQVELDIDSLLLSHNQIEINEYFTIRHIYEVLDLSFNRIRNFDWDLFSLTAHVILSNNNISRVNETCPNKKYTRIRKLDLSGNLITFLRYRMLLHCMPNLNSISLSNNRIDVETLKRAKHLFDVNNIQSFVFRNETNIFFTNEILL